MLQVSCVGIFVTSKDCAVFVGGVHPNIQRCITLI